MNSLFPSDNVEPEVTPLTVASLVVLFSAAILALVYLSNYSASEFADTTPNFQGITATASLP